METYVMSLTPADASYMLDTQEKNRPISHRVVDKYRSDMSEGLWVFTGDPIRFDEDGHLLDGQHRLTSLAGMHEGFSLDFLIIEGLPTSTQLSMDQGRKRTAGSQLSLLGVKEGNIVASAVKTIILYDSGMFHDSGRGYRHVMDRITSAAIERWVGENPEKTEFLVSQAPVARKIEAPTSLTVALSSVFHGIDEADADDFFQRLKSGADLHVNHPILALRNRFTNIRKNKTSVPENEYIGMYITSWNIFRSGRSSSRIQRPKSGGWTRANMPRPI